MKRLRTELMTMMGGRVGASRYSSAVVGDIASFSRS